MRNPRDFLLFAAILAGASYFVMPGPATPPALLVAWKGAGVGLLALWAIARAGNAAGRLVALVLALGALGDVLIATIGSVAGGVAFLAGHVVATSLYSRGRRVMLARVVPIALAIAIIAWLLPADRGAAWGVAIYALGLGAMVATALTSRYPRATVGLGAVMFACSDLLLFAAMGPLNGSLLPGLLIWPLYFAAQTLIAIGVVRSETGART